MMALAALVLCMPIVGSQSAALAASDAPDLRQGGSTIDIQMFGEVVVGQPALR